MHLVSHSPASDSQLVIRSGGAALTRSYLDLEMNSALKTEPEPTQRPFRFKFSGSKREQILNNQLVDKEQRETVLSFTGSDMRLLWVKVGSY